jgi:UDP:flavonoid glycosyltransferase YjiC (YdhE family)
MTSLSGMSRDELAAAVFRDPSPVVNEFLVPLLPRYVEDMQAVMGEAGCVAGTAFALHGPLAAERAGLPFVPLVLQPMLLFSALDPPRVRAFAGAFEAPEGGLRLRWNQYYSGLGRAVLRFRHARALRRVRAAIGLPPHRGTPILDPGSPDVPLRLGLWSELFSPLPADAPEGMRLCGFPPSPEGELPPEVQSWLDEGPPPLVITLGSIAQNMGGAGFWTEAVAMARAMDLRAVLLHGEAEVPTGPDLLPLPYAAHGPLFPQAAAIVHHGGIGTTAEAIRSGRPQLVVPVGDDQPDNAARLERLGLAATVPLKRFDAVKGGAALLALLERFDYVAASGLAERVAAENGAGVAARHLAAVAEASS